MSDSDEELPFFSSPAPPASLSHSGLLSLAHSRTSSAGPSRNGSRAGSRPGSRPASRLGVKLEQVSMRKARVSGDDVERSGLGRGAESMRAGDDEHGHGRRSMDASAGRENVFSNGHLNGNGHILFKAPDEDGLDPDQSHDLDTHHEDPDTHGSSTAPLLPSITPRRSLSERIDDLSLLEGPNSGLKGTLFDGIANMANSIIGAGIVGLPYAVAQAGFLTGILLLIALAAVTDWTIRLVVLNAKLSGQNSYVDVMHHCFGPLGSGAVSLFQLAFAFGGMCAFNVIIGDSIPHVIAYVFPGLVDIPVLSLLVNRRAVIVLCTTLVVFPLSLHRDIVKLSKSSGFALVSMLIIVSSVVLRGVAVDPSLRGSTLHIFTLIRPGIFEAIGVISFAFVCHHNTMFIYQSLHTPTLDRFNAVTHASTSMSLICCLLMAVTGYLVFTNKTQGNILNNFGPDDLVINIARFCFGLNMATTTPLENYVCREVIEDMFFKSKPFSLVRHVVVTGAVIFGAMSVSLVTCDLGVVLEVAGGTSATALAFIFPASAYFTLIQGPWYSRQKLPAVICASFGIVVLVLSVGLTIYKTISDEHHAKVCS